jgi:hypothetical protein
MNDASSWDFEVQSRTNEANGSNRKQQQVTDLPGGGKFISWVDEDGSTWVTTLAHKDLKLLFCRTSGNPLDPALIDACKSMRPL